MVIDLYLRDSIFIKNLILNTTVVNPNINHSNHDFSTKNVFPPLAVYYFIFTWLTWYTWYMIY